MDPPTSDPIPIGEPPALNKAAWNKSDYITWIWVIDFCTNLTTRRAADDAIKVVRISWSSVNIIVGLPPHGKFRDISDSKHDSTSFFH